MIDTTAGGHEADDRPAVHHVEFDPGIDDVAEQTLYAVASVRDVAPEELAPLRIAIDPDALNDLFDPTGPGYGVADGELVFVYEGFEITVTSDGSIRVRPSDAR